MSDKAHLRGARNTAAAVTPGLVVLVRERMAPETAGCKTCQIGSPPCRRHRPQATGRRELRATGAAACAFVRMALWPYSGGTVRSQSRSGQHLVRVGAEQHKCAAGSVAGSSAIPCQRPGAD